MLVQVTELSMVFRTAVEPVSVCYWRHDSVAVDEVCRELVSVDGKKQRFFEK